MPACGKGCASASSRRWCGRCPIAATDVGGNSGITAWTAQYDKINGFSAESIAEALEKLLDSETLRRQLGLQARADILTRYGQAKVGGAIAGSRRKLAGMVQPKK